MSDRGDAGSGVETAREADAASAAGPRARTTPAPDRGVVLETQGLSKNYISGDGSELVVLQGVEMRVAVGEVVAITGASGAGKSTLLHLLGGLDRPTSGEIELSGRPLSTLSEDELAGIRNQRIGFVFQFHHLLREFSALENVMMPGLIEGSARNAASSRARALLDDVGLAGRLTHRPTELSGGEQQRVAVARALVNRPDVLLADEPSGNLDARTSERLHDLLFRVGAEHGTAMVLVTHNTELADRADRTLLLRNGRLEDLHSA